MDKNSKIYIAGHTGMTGSAVCRELESSGYKNIITKYRKDLDLRNSQEVAEFFEKGKPEYVFFCAGRVGGIKANNEHPAEFLYENLTMAANVIHQAYLNNVKKLCFLGSSCIYPRECPQPMKEEYLLTGPLEPTNEGYAIAKLAGYKMAYFYARQYGMNTISLMPCNLYGKNDHFDLEKAHVLSSLVRRFVDAVELKKNEITLWGTGSAKREFMNVDDFAKAAVMLMGKLNSPEIINVGTGEDISIKELAGKIAFATGFKGEIKWDSSMPDGMPRKCLDITKMKQFGFAPEITLEQGIGEMIKEYRKKKCGSPATVH
jgi:GDP-L-fucose synthase